MSKTPWAASVAMIVTSSSAPCSGLTIRLIEPPTSQPAASPPDLRDSAMPATHAAQPVWEARSGDARLVYANDFEESVGQEWLHVQRTRTPNGKQQFLGEFGETSVCLHVEDLPPHKYLRICFDLYLMRSWDGNDKVAPGGARNGPDVWELHLQNGPTLVHTTFSLYPHGGARQAYPDNHPGPSHPMHTGAAESNTLGYSGGNDPMDAVYHFSLVVPHTARCQIVRFSAIGVQVVTDESWGIDNVRIEALNESPVAKLDADAFRRLWDDLASDDPMKAHAAVWTLIAAGDWAVPFLQSRLKPPAVEDESVRRLIADLNHPQWATREEATQALMKLGLLAEPHLRQELKRSPPLEPRSRIEEILKTIEQGALPELEGLRLARAIHVLQVLRSKPAAELLETLASGATTSQVRKQAQQALEQVRRMRK